MAAVDERRAGLIGLAITLVILRIAAQSWRTVRGGHPHQHRRRSARA
ncbi:MAG: hypothetical protein ACR2H2_07985 [Solirubrobacteraceae bacterium]